MALTWSSFGVDSKVTSAKFTEIINNMNIERVRWGKGAYSMSLPVNTVITSSHLAILKDKIDDCVAVTWTKNTNVNSPITYVSVLELQTALNTINSTCVCYCNYACTCRCNYACTCRCNYACTCRCNYSAPVMPPKPKPICTCYCNFDQTGVICTCRGHAEPASCVSHVATAVVINNRPVAECISHVATICPSHNPLATWS